MTAATKTLPTGAGAIRAPQSLTDFEAVVDALKELRYCPLAEFDLKARDFARRLQNAEREAWDARAVMRGAGL